MIFNDYDDQGYRTNIMGCRSSKIADNNLVYNLRHRWPNELKDVSDVALVNVYDEFAMTDAFGNNDENFLAYLKESLDGV